MSATNKTCAAPAGMVAVPVEPGMVARLAALRKLAESPSVRPSIRVAARKALRQAGVMPAGARAG
jgi:hypothetical protein